MSIHVLANATVNAFIEVIVHNMGRKESGNFPEQHHGNLSLWFSASSWPFIRRIVSGGDVWI